MLKIGLTGNIGSGKSTIAKIFNILEIPVYQADTEAKKFLTDPAVIQELITKFGLNILTDNKIDNKKLATIVFDNTDSLAFLNQLIHPLVKSDFDNWCNSLSDNCEFIIMEAAILFESGFDKYVDKTIVVTAPQNIRIERIIKRDKSTQEEILKRMKNQWEEDKKKKLADFLINNNGEELIIPQVIEIHKKIRQLL
jgi:dephospho-CoA kinase